MRIYLDLILLLNFAVDYLLLQGTNRLTGYPAAYGKNVFGAIMGGVYGAVCVIPGFRFLGSGLWRLVFLMLISVVSFGWNKSAAQRIPVFMILSMAFGGIASCTSVRNISGLVLCALLLSLLCRVGFRSGIGKERYIPVELHWQEKCLNLFALQDTGNLLRDPVTGEQVLVCGADVGEELLGIPRSRFRDPVALIAKGGITGLRLIPYHAVGNSGGMMAAIRIRKAVIDGVEKTPLVAFAPEEVARGEVYRMLTGGKI